MTVPWGMVHVKITEWQCCKVYIFFSWYCCVWVSVFALGFSCNPRVGEMMFCWSALSPQVISDISSNKVYVPAMQGVSSVESDPRVHWYNSDNKTFVWLVLISWWWGPHGLESTPVLESSHTWALLSGLPRCFACTMNNSDDVPVDNEENTIQANCCGNFLSLRCGVRLLTAQTLSDLPLYQMWWWLLE